MTDVRLITFSLLKFSKGRTAMLFSAIAASAPAADALVVVVGGARLKKIRELITRATADKSKATVSAILGHWSVLTPGACFHLLLLSFSGTWELPRLSLWRLKRCRRSPYLTSYSP